MYIKQTEENDINNINNHEIFLILFPNILAPKPNMHMQNGGNNIKNKNLNLHVFSLIEYDYVKPKKNISIHVAHAIITPAVNSADNDKPIRNPSTDASIVT